MAGYSIINYKGKEIFYLDYRGMNQDEIVKILDEAASKSLRDQIPRPVLSNVTGIFLVPKVLNKMKEVGKETKHLITKQAVVGIEMSGPKKDFA